MRKTLICKICRVEKEIENFQKSVLTLSGHTQPCKECLNKKKKSNKCDLKDVVPNKLCGGCKVIKTQREFYINLRFKDGLSSKCKDCTKEQSRVNRAKRRVEENARMRRRRKEDPQYRARINQMKRNDILNNPERHMFVKARTRAKRKNLEFSIEVEDIKIPSYCPLLGIKLKIGTKENYTASPSLDRIDNTKGYIKGNIWVISSLANTMKNEASIDQWKTFCEKSLQKLNDDIV